jgi:TonB family protein
MACAAVSTVFTAGAMDHAQAQTNRQSVTNPQPQAIPPVPELPHGKPIVLLAQAQTSPPKPNAASQDGGSISGTVLDPSGARVPGCLVVMHNQSGASENTTRSDAAGIYRFASIPPGHYNLEFQMPGFAKLNMEMAIEAGKALRIDAGLLLGQMSETIEVVGQKPAAAPAPSAAQPASDPDRIAVGGRVDHARLLTHSNPVYPPELQQQGIEGTVRLAAVISRDGAPVEIRVLNGDRVDSRFVQAALDSVRQWRYQPAKLNERPVSTVINIDVNFQLGK